MKWYFSLSEASIDRPEHNWRDLIRVAVLSARANTTLSPHMLYDGEESPFLEELRAMGVKVIRHRVSFHNRLAERGPDYLAVASGAFLRVEIPEVETDDFILYTDCDVLFRSDPRFEKMPSLFAAAPQTSIADPMGDMNTGVMLMNVPALLEDLPQFRDFILCNLGAGWPGCDQENYRRFYAGRWKGLDSCLNWKPYWGRADDAVITHWHGPKPMHIRKLLANPKMVTNPDWRALFESSPESYAAALSEWDRFGIPIARPEPILILDEVSPDRIRGWSLWEGNPSEPVCLTFLLDGDPVWTGLCDQLRLDVRAAGHLAENVGFDFKPQSSGKRAGCRLTVRDGEGVQRRMILEKQYYFGIDLAVGA